ncbi:MAG: hypothetical protein RIC35_18420 [Marinoscillum sp.]
MQDDIYKQALKLERDGKWDAAHELIQDVPTKEAAWIHAYLHRKEGDQWNAEYWYRRADQPVYNGSLDEEWNALHRHFSDV